METITKQQLSDVLLEIWKTALTLAEDEGKPMIAVCKTIADEFGLVIGEVPRA